MLSNRFTKNIRPAVTAELNLARDAQQQGDYARAFSHLENAHVLGQASTYWHVKVHWAMFRWALAQHKLPEVLGQLLRIAGAATKTAWGLVPVGNTGGSNISPFKSLPIPPELATLIDQAKHKENSQH